MAPSRPPKPGAGGFDEAAGRVLSLLAPGDVVSYGEVAAEAGYPGAGRSVGRLLATSGGDLAWWRVVNVQGRLAPGKEDDQARRLRAEGVEVVDGHVVAMRSGRSRRRDR